MVLRTKFNLVMLAAFAVSLVLATVVSVRISAQNARRQVLAEARVMMAAAAATIHYTDTQVAPLLEGRMKVQFLPQAIPFFAAHQTLDALSKSFPGYAFRQAALNPTNPSDAALDWEAQIIDRFKADPAITSVVGERSTEVGQVLTYAQPIRVADGSCLACHASAQTAPPAMIDAYGSEGGFGWKVGDLVAASIVSIPETVALAESQQGRTTILVAMAAVFAGTLVLLNLLLHFIVIVPVRRMSRLADAVSLGNTELAEFELSSRDEIGSLSTSFNRMRRSLAAAMGMLEG